MRVKRTLYFFALFFICIVTLSAMGSQSLSTIFSSSGTVYYGTGPAISWLHTTPRYLKNENNETVLLRGVSWYETYVTDTWNWDPYLRAERVKSAGFNTVRLPLAWNTDPSWNAWKRNEQYRNFIYSVVNACVANDLYIILDFHNCWLGYTLFPQGEQEQFFTNSTTIQDWCNWWGELANRYKDTPNVLYELFNEPRGGTSEVVKNNYRPAMEQAVQAIQGNNSRALILVSDWQMNQVHDAFLTPEYPNIVYVFHRYKEFDGWQSNYPDLYDSGNYEEARSVMHDLYNMSGYWLTQKGIAPVIHGELGIRTFTDGDLQWLTDVLPMDQNNECSWIYWHWMPANPEAKYQITEDEGQTWTTPGQIVIDFLATT